MRTISAHLLFICMIDNFYTARATVFDMNVGIGVLSGALTTFGSMYAYNKYVDCKDKQKKISDLREAVDTLSGRYRPITSAFVEGAQQEHMKAQVGLLINTMREKDSEAELNRDIATLSKSLSNAQPLLHAPMEEPAQEELKKVVQRAELLMKQIVNAQEYVKHSKQVSSLEISFSISERILCAVTQYDCIWGCSRCF